MRRATLDGRRQAHDRRHANAIHRHHVHHFRHTASQRAGLVERDAVDAAGALEMHAALDEHALACRSRQRRDDRDGRRDDERARAGHHEQDECAIDPVVPPQLKSQRRHDRHGRRQQHDGRRVDPREALDERLRRRPLGLRALDQMDDARQRRVAPEPRHADLESAAPVDRPREDLVASRLVDRERFARDRSLVHRALARDHLAVERDFVARPNDDHRARREVVDIDVAFAGRVAQQRRGRRQVHQRADRVARSFQRARFECLRDAEQEHDGRRLRPFAQRRRPPGRDDHQDVDIERPGPQRVQRLADCRGDAGGERQAEAPGHPERRCARERQSEPEAKGETRRPHERLAHACLALAAEDRFFVLEPRTHTGVGDRIGDRRRRQPGGVVFHVEPLPHQVGRKTLQPRQVPEPALEHGDFLTTVHALDLEGRFGVQLADGAGGGHRRSCTCSSPCLNSLAMWSSSTA